MSPSADECLEASGKNETDVILTRRGAGHLNSLYVKMGEYPFRAGDIIRIHDNEDPDYVTGKREVFKIPNTVDNIPRRVRTFFKDNSRLPCVTPVK